MRSIFSILLFVSIISCRAYALDFNDKLSSNIISIYRGDIIKVDRGLEDGIERGDIARLLTKSKSIGRGIAIRVMNEVSYWYVYKQYSKFNEIEAMMMYYRGNESVPLRYKILALEDLRVLKTSEEKKVIARKEDDPDAYLEGNYYGRNEVVPELKKKVFGKDGLLVKAELSPLLVTSDSSEVSYSFGASIKRSGRHNLKASFERASFGSTNQYTGVASESTRTKARANYEIKRAFGDYSYFSYLYYDNKIQDEFAPVRNHVSAGPLGIKHYFKLKNPNFREVSIGYAPSVDYLERDVYISGEGSNVVIDKESEAFLRHALFFDITYSAFDDKLLIYNSFHAMPKHGEFGDTNIGNELRLEYRLGKNFGVNYANEILFNEKEDVTGAGQTTGINHMLSFSFMAEL